MYLQDLQIFVSSFFFTDLLYFTLYKAFHLLNERIMLYRSPSMPPFVRGY